MIPKELQYVERAIFMTDVKTRNFWTFELGTQERRYSKKVIVGFQQRYRPNSQNLINDSLHRTPVTSAQCIIGTAKRPDPGILLNYEDDDYSQGYSQTNEAF